MRFQNLTVAVAAVITLSSPVLTQATPAARPMLAQAPAAQPSPAPSDRRDCPPGVRAPSPRSNETTGSRSLSEQLSESKGVICPPSGVDPGIAVPPVGGGRTPVIPPPGTPGGDPNIVPKP